MGTRRIVYLFMLVYAAAFFVLYPYWFSWYLLILLLLLVPFDLLLSLPGMLTRRISLAAPRILEQGEGGRLLIATIQAKHYPAKCIKTLLRVSGDDFSAFQRLVCSAAHNSRYEFTIDTSRSGVTAFALKRFWVVSLLGLFSAPVKAKISVPVLILPAPAKPPNIVALPRGVILRPKPGGGFSEEHELRPFRYGDPVRSIHWKISAKFDSLIIREPMVPPQSSRLVCATLWKGARERDLVLGRLRWVSAYLLGWGIPYYVRLGSDAPVAEVTKSGDLEDYLYNVLGGTLYALAAPATIPARFTWVFRVDAREAAT